MAKDIELGRVQGLEAESIGVPGQRTFRLNTYSTLQSARLWLEKEQLRALAIAIEQFLAELPEPSGVEAPFPATSFPAIPSIEFHIGRLALSYDQDTDLITMMVRELSEDPDDEGDEENGVSLRLQASRGQMHNLSRQALEVVASGRPLCPLCHAPLDGPTHFCPRQNGHAPITDEED